MNNVNIMSIVAANFMPFIILLEYANDVPVNVNSTLIVNTKHMIDCDDTYANVAINKKANVMASVYMPLLITVIISTVNLRIADTVNNGIVTNVVDNNVMCFFWIVIFFLNIE